MVPSPFFLKLKTGYSNTKVSLGVNWSNIDTKQISFPLKQIRAVTYATAFLLLSDHIIFSQ